MPLSPNVAAFNRATEPVLKILHRDQLVAILGFQASEDLELCVKQLAEKANEGELTDEERSEYRGYAHANQFVAVLQAQARRLLLP